MLLCREDNVLIIFLACCSFNQQPEGGFPQMLPLTMRALSINKRGWWSTSISNYCALFLFFIIINWLWIFCFRCSFFLLLFQKIFNINRCGVLALYILFLYGLFVGIWGVNDLLTDLEIKLAITLIFICQPKRQVNLQPPIIRCQLSRYGGQIISAPLPRWSMG